MNCKIAQLCLGLIMAAALLPATLATAAVKNWNVVSGTAFWNSGSNWSPAGVPGTVTADNVNIIFTNGVARTVTYDYNGPAVTLLSINLDLSGAGTETNTISMSANNLTSGYELIGYSGRGTFNQSGGTNTISTGAGYLDLGSLVGSTGTYNLSGTGALVANTPVYIGNLGTGFFNQTGGAHTVGSAAVNRELHLGFNSANSSGSYSLSGSGSTLTVNGDEYIGNSGMGDFTQSGGTHTVGSVATNRNLYLGYNVNSSGSYTLLGGTLAVNGSETHGYPTGSFTQSGGTHTVSDVGDFRGNYVLSGGVLTVGDTEGIFGVFTQTGGTNTVGNPAFVGTFSLGGFNSVASYSLSSGSLTVYGRAFVGSNTGTTFTQTGGTHTIIISSAFPGLSFSIGDFVGESGTYSLSGSGVLAVTGDTYVGGRYSAAGGTGVMNLNGGTATLTGLMKVWNTPGTAVNLAGATLSVGSLDTDGNASRFNWTAGILNLTNSGLTIGSAGPLGTSLTIDFAKVLSVSGTTTIDPFRTLTLSGGSFTTGNLVNNGTFNFVNGTLEITGGNITGLSSLAIPTNGEFRARGVQSLRITGVAGSTITATGNLTLGNAAAVNGFGTQGTLQVDANTVTLLDANDVVFDSLALATLGNAGSPGTLNAANGLTLDFGGNVTGFGTVSTPNNVAKPLINNGHITGNSVAQPITLPGYVKGVGTFDNVNFTGTFSPGLSPTSLTVGNVALSPSSTLVMELGGTAPGSGHDQLQSSGALAFDGTLLVSLINSFSPAAGQSFNLFDWASTSGMFDALQLPTLAGALAWNTSQLYTTGVLSVFSPGVPGDYNNNGTVDAADYVVWRKNLGASVTLPNDSTPGTSSADYDVWRAHFGQTAGSGADASANAAIPEPATLVLLLVGMLSMCPCRRAAVS